MKISKSPDDKKFIGADYAAVETSGRNIRRTVRRQQKRAEVAHQPGGTSAR
jgi:hypothetical protein